MKAYVVPLIILVCALFKRSELVCLPCNQSTCLNPGPVYCQYLQTTDSCGCCPVCLNGPRQECGGQFNRLGRCAQGLFCYKGNRLLNLDLSINESGKCRRRPRGNVPTANIPSSTFRPIVPPSNNQPNRLIFPVGSYTPNFPPNIEVIVLYIPSPK